MLFLANDNKTLKLFCFAKSLARLQQLYWRYKGKDVHNYCVGCRTCQGNKDNRSKHLGESQAPEWPTLRCVSNSMDSTTHLPKTENGFDCIMTFVDHFSNRIQLICSHATDTAAEIAECFFEHICKLNGLPVSLVSDRDAKFTSTFWDHLMARCCIMLKMSTVCHPKTHQSTEIMNCMIGKYLQCYCVLNQRDWQKLLATAEFAYNADKASSVGMSPFHADLGWQPCSQIKLQARIDNNRIQMITELKRLPEESIDCATFAQRLA